MGRYRSCRARKAIPKTDLQIIADLRKFMPLLSGNAKTCEKIDRTGWIKWCSDIRRKYSPKFEDYKSRVEDQSLPFCQ